MDGSDVKFDRQGNPISFDEWSRLFSGKEYQSVARLEETRDDGSTVLISTVWLGFSHNFGGKGPPLIFETMIFIRTPDQEAVERRNRALIPAVSLAIAAGDFEGAPEYEDPAEPYHPFHERQWLWSTEEEAKAGHDLVVKAYRENLDPDEVIKAWRKESMT